MGRPLGPRPETAPRPQTWHRPSIAVCPNPEWILNFLRSNTDYRSLTPSAADRAPVHSGDTLQPCRTGCDSEEESDFEEEDNFEEESDFEGIGGIGFRSGGRPNGRRRPVPLLTA